MSWTCGLCCRRDEEYIRELNYNNTFLKEVPASVFAHERTLEDLNLEANRIIDLPRALFECHGLRLLNLSDNGIKVMPQAIGSLINLEHLNLSKNCLIDIPDNIKNCKKLRYVNVSGNPLGKLPEGFTQLIALKELYLNDTLLEFLPGNFGRLFKLRVLDLRENKLNTLPKSIGRLYNLQILDISQNKFSDLPEVVGNLTDLKDLWADLNKIRSIPSFIGKLINLGNIDLSNNNIKWVSPAIQNCVNLIYLALSGNELEELPDEMGNLKGLQMLKLDDNDLKYLPKTIGNLQNLEELVVSQNVIKAFPPTIGFLRKITSINADDNKLSELPSELCSCASLRILSVRNNKLKMMPAEIGHLTGIRVMNIADNRLRNLPVSILNLTNLHALWLSTYQTTPLTTLQQEIDKWTDLIVCTNFMFPQMEQERNLNIMTDFKNSEPVAVEKPTRPHIRFADCTELQNTSRLTRAPTPYPKELRTMAKHARYMTTKPLQELSDNEAETPLLGTNASMMEVHDRGAAIKTARVKKPMIAAEMVPMIDQPQNLYDGYVSSHDSEPGTAPRDDSEPGMSGDDYNSTGSMPQESAASRIEDGRSDNTPDLSVTSNVSLPEIGIAHYGRALADQPLKTRSIENILSELNLGPVDDMNGNREQDSLPNDVNPPSCALPTQVKQPPPYHLAAIHSKKGAYFMNATTGKSINESSVPSPMSSSDTTDFSKPPSPPAKMALSEPSQFISPTPVFPQAGEEEEAGPGTNLYSYANQGQVIDADQPPGSEMLSLNLPLISPGIPHMDVEKSSRSLPVKRTIPILKTKDTGISGLPKPQSFTEDTVALDKNVVKPSPQHPRESLSKIPSFTSKEPKMPASKKSSSITSGSSSTKLLQPGFHAASQLPLPKSPVVVAAEETYASMDMNNIESPSNGNRDEMNNSIGSGLGNGVEPERPPSETSVTSPGFKSRIPSLVSPGKGSAPPTSPTSPTWVFGQHKNPTVFPSVIVKNPGLGFSISGGTATATPDKPDLQGIFISKVHPNGPASGLLMTGDKILEVDGIDFSKLEHDQAVGILKRTKNMVHMMISRQK